MSYLYNRACDNWQWHRYENKYWIQRLTQLREQAIQIQKLNEPELRHVLKNQLLQWSNHWQHSRDHYFSLIPMTHVSNIFTGTILHTCPANERRCYTETPSLIGWVHRQNDPCIYLITIGFYYHTYSSWQFIKDPSCLDTFSMSIYHKCWPMTTVHNNFNHYNTSFLICSLKNLILLPELSLKDVSPLRFKT